VAAVGCDLTNCCRGLGIPIAGKCLAIQLEPEDLSYLLSLAQVQWRMKDPGAARRTLEPLLLPNAGADLRAHAREITQEINRDDPRK
jgi:hypothetical protein